MIIALQRVVGFCCTTGESAIAYIYPLLAPPSHLPLHPTPIGGYRAQGWAPVSYGNFPLAVSFMATSR